MTEIWKSLNSAHVACELTKAENIAVVRSMDSKQALILQLRNRDPDGCLVSKIAGTSRGRQLKLWLFYATPEAAR